MELRHLKYFVAVAEEGSLTKASERLGIQQPPLGQQIRDLEAELGVALFDRSPRKVQLNAAGREFLHHAYGILRSAETAVAEVRRFEKGESGSVRIGVTTSASFHDIVPRILRAFGERFPQAEIQMTEDGSFELISDLQSNKIDVALFYVDMKDYQNISDMCIADVTMFVAIPNGHPLLDLPGPILRFSDLVGHGMVSYRQRQRIGLFDTIDTVFKSEGLRVTIVSEASRLAAAVNLVASGRGISIVPDPICKLHTNSVTYRPLESGPMGSRPLRLAYKSNNRLALIDNFIKTVREMVHCKPFAGSLKNISDRTRPFGGG